MSGTKLWQIRWTVEGKPGYQTYHFGSEFAARDAAKGPGFTLWHRDSAKAPWVEVAK